MNRLSQTINLRSVSLIALLLIFFSGTNALAGDAIKSGKKNSFSLIRSNDENFCEFIHRYAEVIHLHSADKKIPGAVSWKRSIDNREEKYRSGYDQIIDSVEIDINGDGNTRLVERKSSLFTGAEFNDLLIDVPDEQRSELPIKKGKLLLNFNINYWGERSNRLYGIRDESWLLSGVVKMDVIQWLNKYYIIADNYSVPLGAGGKIYVFRLNKKFDPVDACMMKRE